MDEEIGGRWAGEKLGQFDVLSLLAVGGSAEIYLARDYESIDPTEVVVLKCLRPQLASDPQQVAMFVEEAKICSAFDHPNLVRTIGMTKFHEQYFLVMEYIPGMSLATMARRTQQRGINGNGLIDTAMVLGLAQQACLGLHYAHNFVKNSRPTNFVHLDISPHNLMIGADGILKIIDFGISQSVTRPIARRSGTIQGKFAYMSPEQCQGREVDRRTDIFALGTLCHELCTGRRLFKRKTPSQTFQIITDGIVPPPSTLNSQLDPAIDIVILKALATAPENRYQTAKEFGDALAALRQTIPGGDREHIQRFFARHYGPGIPEIRRRENKSTILGQGFSEIKPPRPVQQASPTHSPASSRLAKIAILCFTFLVTAILAAWTLKSC